MKRKLFIVALAILLVLYGYRVYAVNNSEFVNYARPITLEHQAGEVVALMPGYYNTGYVDLRGYYITVTGAHFVKLENFLLENGYDNSFYETEQVNHNYQYLYIVDATFHFDGENNPLDNAVDLTSFKLVGNDYYCNFSYEVNGLETVNSVLLQGSSSFSIGSGREIELELPFLVDTDSVWGISPEYLLTHPPWLMVSQYPYEIYISLPVAEVC